jgi:EmrB/QacA subfamily drug resistance transporter
MSALQHRTRGRWLLAATILGSTMVFIDGTAVNVALPALQQSLAASIGDVQWVVEAYTLTLSALMLAGGALGDRYGRRLVFGIGIASFAAASAWCAVAQDVLQLIIARGVQGIAAALLVPGSLSLITEFFSEGERGRAIGTWAGATAITAVAGPLLGGWLIDSVSWRAIFVINLPIAAAALWILLSRVASDTPARARSPLDWPGALLATLGLGGLVFGLIESEQLGLGNPRVLGAVGVGVFLLLLWVLQERRAEAPLLPLELFRSPAFTGTNILTLFLYSALSGTLFFFPLNLIQVRGYTATRAGLALLPLIAIISALSRWAGRLLDRIGARGPLIVGPLIAAAGYLLFGLPRSGGSYWTTYFPAVTVLGLGMAVSVAPLTTVVMAAAPRNRAGVASGINNAVSRVAGLLAIALLGALFVWEFRRGLMIQLDVLHPDPTISQALEGQMSSLAAMKIPPSVDRATAAALKEAINDSFLRGFRWVAWVSAGLAAAAALTTGVSIRGVGGGRRGHDPA